MSEESEGTENAESESEPTAEGRESAGEVAEELKGHEDELEEGGE